VGTEVASRTAIIADGSNESAVSKNSPLNSCACLSSRTDCRGSRHVSSISEVREDVVMPDLAQFLLARITEDELVARTSIESGGGEWWTVNEISNKFGDDSDGLADAAHIARFSPERILAECDAKRRVLDDHFPHRRDEEAVVLCVTCSDRAELAAPQPWPCSTIRALALPYTEHANYREQWRH
jgi:hypothetical protein